MAATIELHIYSSAGVKQAIATDVLSVASQRIVNDIDTLAFSVASASPAMRPLSQMKRKQPAYSLTEPVPS